MSAGLRSIQDRSFHRESPHMPVGISEQPTETASPFHRSVHRRCRSLTLARRPSQFLQEPPIRRLGALRIVGGWRLKPCRKAVSKTHNVARGNRQYEADSTGLAREFTMPSCPWLKEEEIPR